jgi:hypothetical protein
VQVNDYRDTNLVWLDPCCPSMQAAPNQVNKRVKKNAIPVTCVCQVILAISNVCPMIYQCLGYERSQLAKESTKRQCTAQMQCLLSQCWISDQIIKLSARHMVMNNEAQYRSHGSWGLIWGPNTHHSCLGIELCLYSRNNL